MGKTTLIALWNVEIFHVNDGAWLLHPCAHSLCTWTQGEKLILYGCFVAELDECWDEPTSLHLF